MEQRLSLVTLGATDLSRARAFYEALGWTTGAGAEDDVVFFQAGGMIVALWSRASLAEDSGVRSGPSPRTAPFGSSELIERHHPEARTILELACGTGAILEQLQRDYEVVGLDVSRE